MICKPILDSDRSAYNAVITHPLQSYEWGEFREKTGVKVIRRGFYDKNKLVAGFQLTIHPILKSPWTIGYLPKGIKPTNEMIEELKKIGDQERCIFIQLEPDLLGNTKVESDKLVLSAHPLFTKYTFVLDLTKTEEELLKEMHPKTRYNIKVAQKHGVVVKEDNSEKAFEVYWHLTEETTKRQQFYAHTKRYHELQWQTFPHDVTNHNQLTSHLFTATYDRKILTAMLFFVFGNKLYYPYGASSQEHRNIMHSTLTMWEAIRFGKKLALQEFDMWGALGPEADPKDPWFGFHEFKRKYGPHHTEFVGSYDLVIKPALYQGYKIADKLRWFYLKLRK
jgi:lipid II:glycine glycyltransferase (peptidoglycan interpeptide bridge formation enzyme)